MWEKYPEGISFFRNNFSECKNFLNSCNTFFGGVYTQMTTVIDNKKLTELKEEFIMTTNVTLREKIAEIITEEEFCAALLMCDDVTKVQALLRENDIEATVEEIEALRADGEAEIETVKNTAKDELSENDLEDVAGGGKFWRGVGAVAVGAVGGFGLGVVCGVCPAFTPTAYSIATGYAVVAGCWVAAG